MSGSSIDDQERQRPPAPDVAATGLGHVDDVGLVLRGPPCWAAPAAPARDASILDQPLDLRPRLLGQERRQEVVEPHAVVLGLDEQLPAGKVDRRSTVSGRSRAPARLTASGPVRAGEPRRA